MYLKRFSTDSKTHGLFCKTFFFCQLSFSHCLNLRSYIFSKEEKHYFHMYYTTIIESVPTTNTIVILVAGYIQFDFGALFHVKLGHQGIRTF